MQVNIIFFSIKLNYDFPHLVSILSQFLEFQALKLYFPAIRKC